MNVQVATRVDSHIKDEAQKVFARNGLNINDALRIFLTKTAAEKRIPLRIDKPSFSLNGDKFSSDQEYFEQVPAFLDTIDSEVASNEHYTREEVGL